MKKTAAIMLAIIMIVSFSFPATAEDKREEFESSLAIGDWYPAMDTEEQVKTMAENGIQFTFVWAYDYANPHSRQQVEWCGKYGIKVILMDTRLTADKSVGGAEAVAALSVEEIYEIIKPNIDNPTVIGYDLCDEPRPEQLETIGKIVANFKKATDKLIPFVNLYPPFTGLGDFGEYLDLYFKYVDNNFVCFDIYPLVGDTTLQSDYYTALNTAARKARENGVDFWLFIQSMSYTGHRVPTMEELRFQANSALAFGVDKLMSFCYRRPGYTGEFENATASVDADGETKSELWPLTQQLNTEIKALSPIYSQHKYLGTYAFYPDIDNPPSYMNPRALTQIYRADRSIFIEQSDTPLLIGVFDGARMVTNADHPLNNTAATVKVQLRYAESADVTISGKTELYTADASGAITLSLASGEGAFIELSEQKTEEQKKLDALYEQYRTRMNWFDSNNKNVFYGDTYASMKAASDAIEAVQNSDMSYEEVLPLFEAFFEVSKNASTIKEHYNALADVLFEDFNSLDASAFSPASLAELKNAVDDLQAYCDTNTGTETITSDRKLQGYYDTASSALSGLEYTGLYGDVNRDGKFSLVDTMHVFLFCAERSALTATQRVIADIDRNGIVTLSDAMKLFKSLAQK